MWMVCQADDSHVMSSFISSENYIEHALKMWSASHDCRFKGKFVKFIPTLFVLKKDCPRTRIQVKWSQLVSHRIKNGLGCKVIKLFFMIKSVEHEILIYAADKFQNSTNLNFFISQQGWAWNFSCL